MVAVRAVAAPNPMMTPMLVTMAEVLPKLNMRGLSIDAANYYSGSVARSRLSLIRA